MEKLKKSDEFTYWEIRDLLQHMLSIKDVLNSNGFPIREYGNSYFPFHDNYDTPSSKYYANSNTIWCFSENKSYRVIDALKLAGVNYRDVFRKLWDNYTDLKKKNLIKSLDNIYETDIYFKESLTKFNAGVIPYSKLCEDIVSNVSENMDYVRLLYNTSREIQEVKLGDDDYSYLAVFANLNHFKLITSGEILDYRKQLKAYIYNAIAADEEAILIFNMYKNEPFGCTIRGKTKKKFNDVGNSGGIFYGLCDLDKDFKYGDRITIVEGPKDCETYKRVFHDKNCLATMTANLTKTQIEVLKGLTNNIVLANDNDKSGQDAQKTFLKYNSKDFKINIIKHPDDMKDFGDLIPLIRNDKQKLKEVINNYKVQMSLFV